MNIREEITGKKLSEFKVFNTGQYETEEQLGNRRGLTSGELYEFFKKSGKLYHDETLKEYLFKTKDNKYPFGPVVAANNTLYYLSTYWDRAFTDPANIGYLKEILKTKETLQKCFKVERKLKPRKFIKNSKPHWTIEYISTYFEVIDDNLYRKNGSPINNSTDTTSHNGYKYIIPDLVFALTNRSNYDGNKSIKSKMEDILIDRLERNIKKKITKISDKVKNISNPKYECYVFLAITKEGERIAQYDIKSSTERIALQSFMP